MSFILAFLAAVVELAFGYPDRLYRAIGHPVTWMGRLIAWLDRAMNRESDSDDIRRGAGIVALALLLAATLGVALVIQGLLGAGFWLVLLALVSGSLVAQRSLHTHVAAVAEALETGGLDAGRHAVSQIVGRDTASLDEAGISRAAIESLAENFSDGVVAPLFWLALLGLPGAAAYKAVNTADSMIGHRTPRHEAFGWAAARLDDLLNLPASRLSAFLIVAAAWLAKDSPAGAWRALRRDARRHRSPNAGWPEAAMAGALGLALAGPRAYGGRLIEDATMGEGGRREAEAADIRRALRRYRMANGLLLALLALGAGATFIVRA